MTVELAGAAEQGKGTQRMVALGGGLRVPYPEPRDAAATKVGKGNRRTDTKPEVALRSELHRRGLGMWSGIGKRPPYSQPPAGRC